MSLSVKLLVVFPFMTNTLFVCLILLLLFDDNDEFEIGINNANYV